MKTFFIFPTNRYAALLSASRPCNKWTQNETLTNVKVFLAFPPISRPVFIFSICLLLFAGTAKAQGSLHPREWLNPNKKVSVTSSEEQLLFKDWGSQDSIYSFISDSTGNELKFGSDGEALVVYGESDVTEIYRIDKDTCYKTATLPFKTERAAFSHSGEKLFLLHSRKWSGMRLTSYDTRSGLPMNSKQVSSKSNALTVNSSDSLIGISSGTVIRLLHVDDLAPAKVFWEAQKQQQLVFNPAFSMQAASVTPNGTIQIRDLEEDVILAEIEAHDAPIVWLDYDPSGKVLVSLDKQGDLYAWSLSDRQCVLQMEQVEQTPVFDDSGILYWHNGIGWKNVNFNGIESIGRSATLSGPSYFIEREQKSFEYLPQPIITYTPETGMLYGASTSLLFYPKSPMRYPPYYLPSSIIPSVTYAPAGKQFLTGVQLDIHTPTGWHFHNNVSYNIRERNFFFGIGNHARRDDRQAYTVNSFSLHGNVIRNITRELKVGIGYNIRQDTRPAFEEAEGVVTETGSSGGTLVGTGPIVQLDARDDMVFPSKGSFLDTRFYLYRSGFQSDFQYNEMILDYRKYFPINLGKKTDVLALQGFVHATWGGDVPFYQLPHLTADRVLRGVWRNLYIDRQVAFFQAEYRSFIFRNDTRFGYVLFIGAGDGTENFLKDYSNPDLKIAYGAGYRQQLVPKLRLDFRIDFAFTNKGNFGIYGGVGVAF